MVKSIYVPEAGGIINFPDDTSPQTMRAYIDAKYPRTSAPAPAAEAESDASSISDRMAYGFGRGIVDIPGGVASWFYPASSEEETWGGRLSKAGREYIEKNVNIDPTKTPTASQELAQGVGSLLGFLIPSTAAMRGAQALGVGSKLAYGIGAAAGAGQGAAIGSELRSERIRQQLESGMDISEEQQLASQRGSALVGTLEAVPLGRFFKPLSVIFSKVPASKAAAVEEILQNRLSRILTSGAQEGAQEAVSGVLDDLVERGIYNPNVEIGQDLLSNAGTGAFAGSLLEGVIQVAAGRKLQGARQLQKDIASEGRANIEAARQGRISQAAEGLRSAGVEGPVRLEEDQGFEGVPVVSLKTATGKTIGEFTDRRSAEEAVNLYKSKTGAAVDIVEPEAEADVFPIKVSGRKFNTMDEIKGAREEVASTVRALQNVVENPEALKIQAKKGNVTESFLRQKANKDLGKSIKKLREYDGFLSAAQRTEVKPPVVATEPIPYTTLVFNKQEKKSVEQTGENPVIDLSGRKIVVRNINGVKVPFYLSTGMAGKTKVESGKWYPFFGFGPTDKWMNKGSEEDIANFYGSPELKKAAEELDVSIGDIRQDDTVPKVTDYGRHIEYINSDLDPADNRKPDTGEKVYRNVTSILDRIRSGAVVQAEPIGLSEPAVREEGIAAIPEAEVTPTEEPRMAAVPVEGETAPVFKTVKELEVENSTPREYTPEQKEFYDRVAEGIRKRVSSITPEGTVEVRFKEFIDTKPGYLVRGHVSSDGSPNDAKIIIDLVRGLVRPDLSVEQTIDAMLDTLNHEVIHSIKRLGLFRKSEWGILSKAARDTYVPGKKYTYLDKATAVYAPVDAEGVSNPVSPEYADSEVLIEEAVSEMYKDWYRNRTAPQQTKGLFNRITEFFRRVFKAVKEETRNDIFKKIEAGELRGREVDMETGQFSRMSATPLPAYVAEKNKTLFSQPPKTSLYEMFTTKLFGGVPFNLGEQAKTYKTQFGDIDVGKWERIRVANKESLVDGAAGLRFMEELINEKKTGSRERMEANISATVAMMNYRRASHFTAAWMLNGGGKIEFTRPGDIQSATVNIAGSPENLFEVIRAIRQPGPVDPVTGESKDKSEIFKTYAVAKRAKRFKSEGKTVPKEIDDTYINKAITSIEKDYPEIVAAYEMYQRVNENLLQMNLDAGVLTPELFNKFTKDMDYYGFYQEFYEEPIGPEISTKPASRIKIRAYKGTEDGGLVNDPVYVMVKNAQFWMTSAVRNVAISKAFEIGKLMNEARILKAGEKPNEELGEDPQVMFFRENGVEKRFAVSDPLLVASLGSAENIDMGEAMRLISIPTNWLRESVTRDPVFSLFNPLRDTISAWQNSGEDFTPVIDTFKGMKKALNREPSFMALMGRGAVGSYDVATLPTKELADKLNKAAGPKNVNFVKDPRAGLSVLQMMWDKAGVLSDASDAGTRIAVYEAAIKAGASEAEAAARAIEIIDFSRRGTSSLLQVLAKIVPFLNARIQGLDVLYQAGGSGYRYLRGESRSERDMNIGKKFLNRGLILAGISIALDILNKDDEDYQQLDDYVKNGNLLVPLKWFGYPGQFLAYPKPFENGMLFSTLPQQAYKTLTGEGVPTRENAALFYSQFVSTFGINLVPQFMLPVFENYTGFDFYTGLPLVAEGTSKLAPELQYTKRTSQVAMLLSEVPVVYDFDTGRFRGMSPVAIDNLISGYGGPIGSYFVQAASVAAMASEAGPDRLPMAYTDLPGVRRILIDAKSRNPKVVSEAYELFRVTDEVNRSFNRLRQIGEVEAVMAYLEENRTILAYRKNVFKLVDGLNKITAQERRIERDTSMTDDEKREAMIKLRAMKVSVAMKIQEINTAIGR